MSQEKLRHDWTASVLVLGADRRVLLLFHKKLGVWLGPGGHVEPFESPDQAALREVLEETGLDVCLLGPRDASLDDARHGVLCLPLPYVMLREHIHDPKDPHIHLDHIYCARLSGGAADESIAAARGARFFGEQEIAGLPMFDNYRALLLRVFGDQGLWASIQGRPATAAGAEERHVAG
ncbi:MAG: NUDIX domain-containing protein [Polyangiaceae bacterium]